MDGLILAALMVLIGLAAWSVVTQRSGGASAKVDALANELNATRQGVEGAKDVLSQNTLSTISEIKGLGGTIQKLVQQQEEAAKLGQSLKDLLQSPKLRGSYSEQVLEEILERILPRGLWDRQVSIEGREQVDFVVRCRGVVIPIDAKFPRKHYLDYLSAPPEEKAGHWKEFEGAVKIQIRSIESKYIKPEKGTSEFALMFIPSEAIYYETISENNHLGDPSDILGFAQDHHVFPVSPNTFYAFLQVVMLGIRNVEIIKSAKKLQEALSGLERSFGFFYNKFEEIGKSIDKAAEAYRVGSDHIERYKRSLNTALVIPQLDADEQAALPEDNEIEKTDAVVR